ncbi:MAG: hypothetical protein HYV09_32590 [Deltaproteobacteria bacterium]|nr:hypothetical protein [Deltaproteobacteria bacterium]
MTHRSIATSLLFASLFAGCAAAPEDGTEALRKADERLDPGTLSLSVAAREVHGNFESGKQKVSIDVRVTADGVVEATLHLRGLVVLLTHDPKLGTFDVDGFADDGSATALRDADRALIHVLDVALGSTAEKHPDNAAVKGLVKVVTLLSSYPETTPLRKLYMGRFEQSSSLCAYVNRPGVPFPTFVEATHDCYGKDRWHDTTTFNAFLSRDPAGPCSDETWFSASSLTGYSCYEPDHPWGDSANFGYGDCMGRCGGGCGTDNVYSRDCTDHDACVRFGHTTAAVWCDDEFTGAAWDAINGTFCSMAWRNPVRTGTSSGGNCDWSHYGTWDGCDGNCQFIDPDCYKQPAVGDGFCQDVNHMGSENCSNAFSDCWCGAGQYCAGAGTTGADQLGCKASTCCPKGSWDGANCYVGAPAAGTSPFVWNNALYTSPVKNNCSGLAGAGYDGANCFYQAIPADRATYWSPWFGVNGQKWWYISTNGGGCPAGYVKTAHMPRGFGDYDSWCESAASAPAGTSPFVYANNFYFTPQVAIDNPATPNDERCPKGSWDGANCHWGATPSGTHAFVYNNNLYYTVASPSQCTLVAEPISRSFSSL